MLSINISKRVSFILHIANILIILVLTNFFLFKQGSFTDNFVATLKYFPVSYTAFYLTNSYITPLLFFKKKYAQFAVASFLLTLITAGIVMSVFTFFESKNQLLNSLSTLTVFCIIFFLHLLFVFKGFAVVIIVSFCKSSITKSQLSKQKNKEELQFLMHQMESHFLFNTINNLYALALESSKKMPQLLLQLTDVLRHIVYNSPTKKIELNKELDALNAYIAVLQLGYEQKLPITINEDLETETILIPSCIILTLVEGAVKHICFKTNKTAFIDIKINDDKEVLNITVSNSICPKNTAHSNGGVGLVNLQKRLEILYPYQNVFSVSTENNTFAVTVKIPIDYEDMHNC